MQMTITTKYVTDSHYCSPPLCSDDILTMCPLPMEFDLPLFEFQELWIDFFECDGHRAARFSQQTHVHG